MAVKAVERQYLRPGNHTRARNFCSAWKEDMDSCNHRPSQRVYLNSGPPLLLCYEHSISYLDAPRTHGHVKNINRRYRANRNWADTYRAN